MLTTKTTTKALIFASLILTFSLALQDGDQVAFKTHGSFFNAKYQYLNAGTVDGSVSMAANTDYASASGTWWKAHKLSDGSWGFESLGNIPNAQHIYLNANTYTGAVDLAGSTDYTTVSGTHWSLQNLSDGTVALKCLGSHNNPQFVYLNANTYSGAVNLAGSTDFASLSGTHWEIVTLVPASTGIPVDNSQLANFIQANADDLKEGSDVDVSYCLQQFDPATFEAKYEAVMNAIINAGCVNGLQNCDVNDLYNIVNQLKGSGANETIIQQVSILIGSIIGSMAGSRACAGVRACEFLGGRIGTVLACLSVSKEAYEGMMTAIATLEDVTNQAGDIGQDAVNAINDAANTAENGVQDAINQINQGTQDDVISALQGVTNDVGQSFTDLGNQIAGGLSDAGGAIAGAGQQAVGAVEGAGQQIASGFCGVFGC